jgi:hypothetical protein
MGKTVRTVQVDFDGDTYHVECIMQDDERETDSCFAFRTEAETRAKKIADLYHCDFETNY